MNTQLIRSNYTEAWTTTTHPEVMQLCMDIPVDRRINHTLHKKWIISKYPDAAKYKWEKTDSLITSSEITVKLRNIIRKIRNKTRKVITRSKFSDGGMNPLDFWVKNNKSISTYMDKHAASGFSNYPTEISERLNTDMLSLYEKGSISEKAMVLTVLASLKLYFGDISYGSNTVENKDSI